jgi:hypothetical protein
MHRKITSLGMVVGVALAAGIMASRHTVRANEPATRPAATAVTTHEQRMAEVKKRASAIVAGMTRVEVEKLFHTQDGGLIGRSVGRYYEDPEVMIEVPFDNSGEVAPGQSWSADDKVTGAAKVYRSMQHLD